MDGWLHSVAYDVTLTDLSGAPYTGAAEVAIPVPDGWNTAYLRAYVQESDGSYSRIGGAYADGVYTASVPHFSVVAPRGNRLDRKHNRLNLPRSRRKNDHHRFVRQLSRRSLR